MLLLLHWTTVTMTMPKMGSLRPTKDQGMRVRMILAMQGKLSNYHWMYGAWEGATSTPTCQYRERSG
jgi:hypothetical protein